MNGEEHIQQTLCSSLQMHACRTMGLPDEWEDDDSAPGRLRMFTFEADFQSIRCMDSEAEADTWDKQIEEDANSGSLDALAEKAIADFEAGKYTEFVRHATIPEFWRHYRRLPLHIQRLADENFQLLKRNPRHTSLQFKKVGRYWSARVGIRYRALAYESEQGFVWFWIGMHDVYDRRIRR